MRAALRQILSSDPIDQWARGSIHAWDFLNGTARFNYGRIGRATSTPGWSYTRADSQNAYAQTPGGVLVPFATGQLRRVDGKGVLIEGARTNLCLQSQTFDNASWTKTTATVTADAVAAPDGTTTADKLVEDNSNAQHRLNQSITVSSATAYTFSVYVKAAERLNINMRINSTSNNANASFNLQAGTALTPNAGTSGIAALGGGWYRCWITGTTDGTGGVVRINLGSTAASASEETYVGDNASGVYLWGAQLEAGAFPSSVVPTVAASATRAAEPTSVSPIGADYPLSGVVRFMRAVDTGGVETLVQIDDGSANNRVRVAVDASDRAELLVDSGGVTQAQIAVTGALALNTVHTIAWRVGSNTAHICVNGTLGTEDTSVTVPATPTAIRFGAGVSSALPSFGYGQRAALWTRLLANGELQSLAAA